MVFTKTGAGAGPVVSSAPDEPLPTPPTTIDAQPQLVTEPAVAPDAGVPTPTAPPPARAPTKHAPNQPTVVGGGSAADHGVFIGKNVTIGDNVIVGGGTPLPATPSRSAVKKPADYNAKRFDPVGYVGSAEALARQLLPDAALTSFEFDPVWPDGHVDLTIDGRDREYEFRSPAASARPADVPKNLPYERTCLVHVEVTPTEVTAELRRSDTCDQRLVAAARLPLRGDLEAGARVGDDRRHGRAHRLAVRREVVLRHRARRQRRWSPHVPGSLPVVVCLAGHG